MRPPHRFFIVGMPKAATTTLYNALGRHPEIAMSAVKEPHHFSDDLVVARDPGGFERMSRSDYDALWAGAQPHQVRGEASTSYLYSSKAAQNIARFAPDAKIIAVFREPTDFLASYFSQQLRVPGREVVRDIERALQLEPERRMGRALPQGCPVPELLFYRDQMRIAAQLRRYTDVFEPSQVRCYVYDDLSADPSTTLADMCDFIGVAALRSPVVARHNVGRIARIQRASDEFRRLARGEGLYGPVHRLVVAAMPRSIRKRSARFVDRRVLSRDRPDIPATLQDELRREMAGEVAELGDLIGRDLTGLWGY